MIRADIPVKDVYTVFYADLVNEGFSALMFFGMFLSLSIQGVLIAIIRN
jgi:hypothetical protein